jgi:hypothetical protein
VEVTTRAVPGVELVDLQELRLAETYTVQPDDRGLQENAMLVYGSVDLWDELARANNIMPPYVIQPGQALILPPLEQ